MRQRGFTLIELLVTIAVIGVLSGIILAALNPSWFFGKGRDGRRLSDLTAVQAALELYYAENAEYPPAGGVPFGDAWDPYLKSVPEDPQAPDKSYAYCVDAAQENYVVCADMEDTANPPDDCLPAAYGCSKNCCLTNPF